MCGIGIYLRLSREDAGDEQSQSIVNQQDFLTAYVKKMGWPITETYIDDGFSGLNFNRPGFQRLLRDIENGRINTVVTKDLSRLGRDYIQTGYYTEIYFPSHHIRYIAVNDGIDTHSESGGNDLSPFRSVINDMYAKDISKKVRTALTTKKIRGEFIGSTPPYGYKKDPDNKNHLVVDRETAPNVRKIFKLFLSGCNLLGIANELTRLRIPTPSQAKNLACTQKRIPGVWNGGIVRRILTSETYIGNLTQNRSKSVSYKLHQKINLPKDAWTVVEGTHEAIISGEDFDAVRQMLSKRSYVARGRQTNVAHLLTGLVFCADCGSPMSFVRESETRTYLTCRTWRDHAKLKLCTSHCIREDYVADQIKKLLKSLADRFIDSDKLIDAFDSEQREKNDLAGQIRQLEAQLNGIKDTLFTLYADKVRGVVSERDYIELSERLGGDRGRCAARLELLKKQGRDRSYTDKIRAYVREYLNYDNLERSDLLMLVDKIYIHKDKKITVAFTFADPNME
jgi:Site-specific recombinases, DNA invertase Pin homologs